MTSRRRVLLAQLPIPPPGPQPIHGNVPLAAGYLQAFAAQRGLADHYDMEILPPRLANDLGDQALVGEVLARQPWLVGFSCYVWNLERTLWLAEQLKRRRPDLTVVVGGPEITADNDWVLSQPQADYAIVGEGEPTFAELLAALRTGPVVNRALDGLAVLPCGQPPRPRATLPDLDEIPSPYLSGVLDVAGEKLMPLETVRGCAFRCKYCYYPKQYEGVRCFSAGRILAELIHASERGVEEVVLLDPTLNQRGDFVEFLRLLRQGNPGRPLRYAAELRAETITPAEAELMAEAGCAEVEIGLQTVSPAAQQLIGRCTPPAAFVRGAKALMSAGIKTRVDLILGLPGDTVDSVRQGIALLAESGAYDQVQLFHLSILPGTAFRAEAEQLGLAFQPRPPYYVLQTPTLDLTQMAMLMEEAQEAFGTEMDPLPPPVLDFAEPASGPQQAARIHLDQPPHPWPAAEQRAQAFTLWLTAADFRLHGQTAAGMIQRLLDESPHTTLQVVLEPLGQPECLTAATLELLLERCYRSVSYLDRYYSVHPGHRLGAKRLVVLAPAAERNRLGPQWRRAVGEYATLAWRGGSVPEEELEEYEFLVDVPA